MSVPVHVEQFDDAEAAGRGHAVRPGHVAVRTRDEVEVRSLLDVAVVQERAVAVVDRVVGERDGHGRCPFSGSSA